MNPLTLMIFALSLITGTLITFSSSNWLVIWMGLEINTMAIIPIMAQKHHPRATEAATKYFLIQAPAAATILFIATTNAWLTGQWEINQISQQIPATMILLALAMKMGLAPTHTWLPEVIQGLEIKTALLLSTWQKLAPFSVIIQMHHMNTPLLIILGSLSVLMGGWAGLNQTQTRKILAYSSITHMGWMVIILQFLPELTMLTLTIYLIMTFSVFMMIAQNNSYTINKLPMLSTKLPMVSSLMPLTLLSLGGLPPLTGFMPKWLILQELSKQGLFTVATTIALGALLSLYFYLRLSYAASITMSPNNHLVTTTWRLSKNSPPLAMTMSIVMSMAFLPITPSVTALFMQ
uniref:NADH-ubiquinone oxidoreductase chain 2 n=1 Tax=Cynoglossus quadrilineatus TaxID=3073681 RepID=V9IN29_9PLEU|nr:NADH dehydrogenase subunit 2 [Cynoglossus quadrilineatus]AFB71235.1 NADH dehydrogenase subunit 2 [Cynoglossus quadrilineatus]